LPFQLIDCGTAFEQIADEIAELLGINGEQSDTNGQ
jgi:hypothetical protein